MIKLNLTSAHQKTFLRKLTGNLSSLWENTDKIFIWQKTSINIKYKEFLQLNDTNTSFFSLNKISEHILHKGRYNTNPHNNAI